MNVQIVGNEWMISNEISEVVFIPVVIDEAALAKLPPCGLNEAFLRANWPEYLNDAPDETIND